MTDLLLLAVRDLPVFVLYKDEAKQAICLRCRTTYPLPRGLGEWTSAVGLKAFGSEHRDCLQPAEQSS